MGKHNGHHYEQTQQECFFCALDPNAPCTVPQLKGHIIYAHEVKVDGEMTPFITIDLGTEYASFSLTRHYRSLVKGLNDLGIDLRKTKLTLCVYHLPQASSTTEHKGRILHRYRANDYTLAILEPDTILNITDLNHAEYCPRQYLLYRLASSPRAMQPMERKHRWQPCIAISSRPWNAAVSTWRLLTPQPKPYAPK